MKVYLFQNGKTIEGQVNQMVSPGGSSLYQLVNGIVSKVPDDVWMKRWKDEHGFTVKKITMVVTTKDTHYVIANSPKIAKQLFKKANLIVIDETSSDKL